MEAQKPPMINRQAVIVIHGIGEQRPMDTLRKFVENIAPQGAKPAGEASKEPDRPPFYNKPDPLSDNFELRRLTAYPQANSFKTDYYEFYWAHLMQGTQLGDVAWWIRNMFVRPPGRIPTRLRWLYFTVWGIFLTLLTLLVLVLWWGDALMPDWLTTVMAREWFKPVSSFLIGTVWLVIAGLLKHHLGDAVRYFTPRARNVAERQAIRQAGVSLLRRLHDAKIGGKNQYDRIMVVGHSLGSVIAYDLLCLFWNERHTKLPLTPGAIDRAEAAADTLKQHKSAYADSPETATYRQAQFNFWRSQYDKDLSWRVSDLITAGSPLAFADLYLADTTAIFFRKQKERETATCPPAAEPPTPKQAKALANKTKTNWFSFPASDNGTPRTLHHAALFAMTRWTNLFFTNDYVGGPVTCFGPGVVNKKLIPKKRRGLPFISHGYYWHTKEPDSLNYLRERMELRFRK